MAPRAHQIASLLALATVGDARRMVDLSNAQMTALDTGTPGETVETFCDETGLKEMRGHSVDPDAEDASNAVEKGLLQAVTKELENNNVDQMAKSIFSFYVCARWAPDKVFWKLAEQELTMQMANQVLNDDNEELDPETANVMAIADMYRTYQFVPMLCSTNFEVFKNTDNFDGTYFHAFKTEVKGMMDFIEESASGEVAAELTKLDQTFCGDKPMMSCDRHKVFETLMAWFGSETAAEKQAKLAEKIQSFADHNSGDFKEWKGRFPFHSFIAKPKGWQADASEAPKSDERFVVCFGKRVASELHRRPNGNHILTDQNNVGCHGWYSPKETNQQLLRMMEMWKPPTCQLATMGFEMKKEIMAKFHDMNQRLFEALPSLINDELQEQENEGEFNFEDFLPQPVKPKSLTDPATQRVFVDGMLVSAVKDVKRCVEKDAENKCKKEAKVEKGSYGRVVIENSQLEVSWGEDTTSSPQAAEDLKIMPSAWKAKKGFMGHVRDLVAGVSSIKDKAKEIWAAINVPKKKNLANLMSNSVSKWAVCPIKGDADLEALDNNIGTEDAVFQDFQREAYGEWNGKKLPGKDCVAPPADTSFPSGTKICSLNEYQADHVEKYTKNDHTKELEKFICPLTPPLSANDQLQIMIEQKDMCFLHMTGRQEQQYGWHYQGFFPARRQYERKENVPKTEYELIRLTKVADDGIEGSTTFSRWCTLEELQAQPRFCNLPKVENEWSTMTELAHDLAESLESAFDGAESVAPTGIGATAEEQTLAAEQGKMKKDKTRWEKVKEGAKWAGDKALWLGEKTWDKIRGGYRLTVSSAKWAKMKLTPGPHGNNRMAAELEAKLFGEDTTGNLLHSLSFQRALGKSNGTSNSKDRFERYMVSYPCPNFDPALEFALKKKWSQVAVRMIREGYNMFNRSKAGVLNKPVATLMMRGEALRYRNTRSRTVDVNNFPKASMKWDEASHEFREAEKCEYIEGQCQPVEWCEKTFFHAFSNGCKARVPYWKTLAAGEWWSIDDTALTSVVAPIVNSGSMNLKELYGLKMTLHCAPKKNFGAGGPPSPASSEPLVECLKKGVETNAKLKAQEPWKMYFPDEVIVVAQFEEIEQKECYTMPDAHPSDIKALCAHGSVKMADAKAGGAPISYSHLINPATQQPFGHDKGDSDVFQGVHKGAGFPKGTLSEVVLSPQDVLEALDMIVQSHGR
mmetsp:Transcript_66962/g.145517  ORF Transcript_66962/g.145517 Transcript_66962/m.145517 type:complete len:1199 (+) Transcript_66962:100-3696(+)